MAESPEHEFLSATFLEVLSGFSALKLYGYREADRRRFDFAATITRDWSRPLAGQTLWSHTAGIDKDVRMLLTDRDSEIKAYVARDNIKNHGKLAEVIDDYKGSDLGAELFKLKTIWVPDGFDADDERARATMSTVLRSAIVEDILFNVVFGRLSARDVAVFLSSSGRIGLQLALLAHIAEHTIGNVREASEVLGVSAGSIRERLLLLQSAGFVAGPHGAPGYSIVNEITTRGRVFIDLLRRVRSVGPSYSLDDFSPELAFILTKLGCSPSDAAEYPPTGSLIAAPPLIRLLDVIAAAEGGWHVDLQNLSFTTLADAGKLPPSTGVRII